MSERKRAVRGLAENTSPERTHTNSIRKYFEIGSYLAVLFALQFFVYRIWPNRHMPSLGTDSLIYHLTLPARWMREGYLAQVDLPFHDSAAEHSPMLFQSLVYLCMRVTGDDGLTWLLQPAFYLLTYVLFYISTRLLTSGRRLGLITTALLVFHTPFLNNLNVTNNDMGVTCGCAMFLCGLLVTQVRLESGTALASVGMAMMLATKVIGLVYCVAGLPCLLAVVIYQARRSERKVHWLRLSLAVAAILSLGSIFFFRNLLYHHNPLYPATVELFGVTLLPGLYDASVLIDHHWSPQALAMMLFNDDDFFALRIPTSFCLWAFFLVSVAFTLLVRRPRRFAPSLAVFVVFPIASVILFFLITPFWREHRLLFPLHYMLWLGSANAFARLAHLPIRGMRRIVEGILLLVFMSVVLFSDGVILWLLLVILAAQLAIAIGWAALGKHRRLARRLVWGAACLAIVAAAVSGPWWYPSFRAERDRVRQERYEMHYGARGHAWALLAKRQESDEGCTVAYAGTATNFPLFGTRLQNRVCYIPVSAKDHPQPIDLHPGDQLTRRLAEARRSHVDDAYWLQGLQDRHVNYLYLASDSGPGSVDAELGIVRRHPEMFQLLFAGDDVLLFAVSQALRSTSNQ